MKRILYSIIILSAPAIHAQTLESPTEIPDTVVSIENPSNIILTETPDGITLQVEGTDSVTTFSYTHPDPGNVDITSSIGPSVGAGSSIVLSSWGNPKKTSYDMIIGGLSFGKNFAFGQTPPMDITTGKSWEISWMYIVGIKISRGGNSFTTGIGMNWRNYKLTGPYQFSKADGHIDTLPYPEGTEGEWSRLKVTTLSIPLLYSRQIWKKLYFTAGGIVNFATHSSIKSRFTSQGREITTSQNGIYPRPVTVDVYGAVTVCCVGWYVRYSPMDVIRDNRGPKFTSLSTGIVLNL